MPINTGATSDAGLATGGQRRVDWGIEGTEMGFPTSKSPERLFIAVLRADSHSDSAHEDQRIRVSEQSYEITTDLKHITGPGGPLK